MCVCVCVCAQAGTESPAEMPAALTERRKTERRFLEQLLDIRKLDSYTVPVPIKADLRKYQQVELQGHDEPQLV